MDTNSNLGQLLFETAGYAICVIRNSKLVEANPAAAALFGCRQEQLINKDLLDFSPTRQPNQQDSKALLQQKTAAALDGKLQQFEWLFDRTNGDSFYAQITLSRVDTATGSLLQAHIIDISEYKQAELALQDSERRLADLINFLPDATFAIDTHGTVIAWNRAMEQLTGLKANDVLGQDDYIYSLPFYGERRPILANMVLEPDDEIAKNYPFLERVGESLVTEVATPYLTGEGNAVVWAKARRLHNAEGEIVGAIESVRDITQRKLIENQLRESESRTRMIIETTLDAVVSMSEQGVITEWNSQAEDIFGWSRAEVVGQSVTDVIMPHRYRDAHVQGLKHFLKTGEGPVLGQRIEITALHRSGQEFPVELSISPYYHGEQWMFSAFVRDITNQKQLEQQFQNTLERRERQVRLSAVVAQDTVLASNLEDLYQRVVTKIKDQFEYYHVQMFRHDPDLNALVLAAGYGDVGETMVSEAYQVPLGEKLVGTAAALGYTLLRSTFQDEPEWQPHPNLPDTTDEIAVPIRLGQQDAQAQATALYTFIKKDFDGAIICVTDPDIIGPAIQQATESGLAVLTQSHDMGDDYHTLYVGAKEFETGYALGLQAGEWANAHLALDQSLKMGVFNHNSLPPVAQREAGILAGIKAIYQRDVEIVANETAPNAVVSLPLAMKWLETYPNLNMIVAINDAGALGAYQAVKAAGKNDPDKFFIGGVDGIDNALDAIAQGGAFQATVDKSAWVEGVPALHNLVAAIVGKPYLDKVLVETRPINRTNLAQILADRQNSATPDIFDDVDLSGIKIGLSVMNLDNPFFEAFAQVVAAEAAKLGVQLVVHDPKPVLGVLNVHVDQSQTLDAEDRIALEGLGGQLAVAIENVRLLGQANVFRQFTESAGQGLGMASLDGKAIYMNPALLKMLGEDKLGEVIGKSLLEYYPEDQQHIVSAEVLPTVLETGQWLGELTMRTVNGPLIPVIQNVFLMHDDAGNPLYIATSVTDISEQQRTAAELESRLAEVNTLQRLMTREGWQQYQAGQEQAVMGYLFEEGSRQPIPVPESLAKPQPGADNVNSLVVPMAVHGEEIGQVSVYSDPDHPLEPEDQLFVNSVVEQVAEALERARLLEQTHKRAIELEAVAQVGTVASTVLEVDKLLQTVVDLTKTSFDLYHAHIYLLREDESVLELAAGAGDVGRQMVEQGWQIFMDNPNSIVAQAARTQNGVIVNDVTTSPHHLPNPLLPDTRAELAAPLVVGSSVLGVLDVQANVANRFTDDDVRIQITLASQVAVALQNTILYQQTQAALVEVEQSQALTEGLYQAIRRLNAAPDLQEALAAVMEGVDAPDINRGELIVFERNSAGDIETGYVVANWHSGTGPAPTPIGTRDSISVIQTLKFVMSKEPVFFDDTFNDERVDSGSNKVFKRQKIRAMASLPLWAGNVQLGTLLVKSERVHTFTPSEIEPFISLAAQLTVTVENQRLLQETQVSLQETALLYRVTRKLTEAADLQDMFEMVLPEYLGYLNLKQGGVLLFDNDNVAGTLRALMVDGALAEAGLKIPIDNNPACQKAMATKEAVAVVDARHDPLLDPVRNIAHEFGYLSMLLVPITVHGNVIGVLGADSTAEVRHFLQREIALVQAVADQLAIAIERQRLAEETRQALKEVERTQRRYTVQAWETYRAKQQAAQYEQLKAGAADLGDELPVGLEKVIETKKAAVVAAVPKLGSGEAGNGGTIDTAAQLNLLAPLKVRDEIIGILGLQEVENNQGWTPEEVTLVEAIAEQMAQAAEKLRLLDESQQRAAREQRANEIGEKIRSAQTLEEALRIAVKEVGVSLKAPQTAVEIKLE